MWTQSSNRGLAGDKLAKSHWEYFLQQFPNVFGQSFNYSAINMNINLDQVGIILDLLGKRKLQ